MTALYQLPHRVFGPMQRQIMQDQIMRTRRKVQHRGIRHDPRARPPIRPIGVLPGHDRRRRKPSVNLGKTILDLARDRVAQERHRVPRGPCALGVNLAAICKGRVHRPTI
jgi:hypothetical protein